MKNLVFNDITRRGALFVRKVSNWFLNHEGRYREARTNESITKALFRENRVVAGPFAGMQYPQLSAVGSALLPKFSGAYESELIPALESVIAQKPQRIIDIGCAEGYYAVGLARRLPDAEVYAVDIDNQALQLCRQMAELNGVSDRVRTVPGLDARGLRELAGDQKAFVISDCEGFELELFDEATVAALRNSFILIELHTFVHPGLPRVLADRFRRTHTVDIINTEPNETKLRALPEAFRGRIPDADLIHLVDEIRPQPMEWMVCYPTGTWPH